MVDFRQLLSTNIENIEAPKPLPTGTWTGQILSRKFDESRSRKTPFVAFTIGNLQPGDDVDAEEVQQVKDLGKKTIIATFYLSPDAQFRIKDLIESCGYAKPGMSLAEGVEELVNAQVMLTIAHRPSEDGKTVYIDVKDVKGAE